MISPAPGRSTRTATRCCRPCRPTRCSAIYALRAGVNIMMYMLTGNYKSDQVHVPVLLERLGQ